jgi:hypothetical protein
MHTLGLDRLVSMETCLIAMLNLVSLELIERYIRFLQVFLTLFNVPYYFVTFVWVP